MARKKKEFNKDGPFQIRFRNLFDARRLTQNKLAIALGVSRPTVAGWLNGDNIPDIQDFEKIARYFKVSADYLLGLTDTAFPDITARAAVQYTGLSEEAIKCLHDGLDDFGCGLSDEGKKEHLAAASALIQSEAFAVMVDKLGVIEKTAYLCRILEILRDQHLGLNIPKKDTAINRNVVVPNLIHVCEVDEFLKEESISKKIGSLEDTELKNFVLTGCHTLKKECELHQFHSAKAFTGFIDQLTKASQQKAEQRFDVT